MKNKLTKIGAVLVVVMLGVASYSQQVFPNEEGTPRRFGHRTVRPKRGYLWISWEEDGRKWMVGARKEDAAADNDPGLWVNAFSEGYCIKVQGEANTGGGVLFHNCCTTNIQILPNYTGTIQIGTNFFKVGQNFLTQQ